MGLFNKYSVSVLNNKWETVMPIIKVKHLPRSGELIFREENGQYYRVLNVVHSINSALNKYGVFVIVDVLEQKPQVSENQ